MYLMEILKQVIKLSVAFSSRFLVTMVEFNHLTSEQIHKVECKPALFQRAEVRTNQARI